MDRGTGEGYTHADHPALASQLYAAYARARQVRMLASVVGDEGLLEVDRHYLDFGDEFEQQLLTQAEPRSLATSMDIGWALLCRLPVAELTRLSDEQIDRHIRAAGREHG
jgi:V/A-type H+-transporting ATPase subunit B